MDYFQIVNLTNEPFSNSPDPDFFFQSDQHRDCLQKLELALRLKRGLNVVIGEIGTGKTTLCRQLIRRLPAADGFETHLVLDPTFDGRLGLLENLASAITGKKVASATSEARLKEIIKEHLFTRGVEEDKTVVLIIDEGQKLSPRAVEQLRELLNFETNNFKLLQIVIFAQPEFRRIMADFPNFADRINMLHLLGPFDLKNTRRMIDYRLKRAGCQGGWKSLFTAPAIKAIYRITKGYPRKLITICHHCILGLIVKDGARINRSLVLATARRNSMPIPLTMQAPFRLAGLGVLAAGAILLASASTPFMAGRLKTPAINEPSATTHEQPVSRPIKTRLAGSTADTGKGLEAATLKPPSKGSQTISASPNRDEIQSGPEPPGPASPTNSQPPPEILGAVKVRANDTLADLIVTVYGSFQQHILDRILALNPGIADPDRIKIGQKIVFPAFACPVNRTGRQLFWIRLATAPTLAEALELYGQLKRHNLLPLQLLPSWQPQRGMNFEIIVKGYLKNRPQADKLMQALITLPGQGPVSIDSWPRDAVFFADPYANRLRAKLD